MEQRYSVPQGIMQPRLNGKLSDSSLNPDAAEFVPSFSKIKDVNPIYMKETYRGERKVIKEPKKEPAVCIDEETKQRNLRQLHHMMKHMAEADSALGKMYFSLTPNGQGISVQFVLTEAEEDSIDDKLCVDVGHGSDNALATHFLQRMCGMISGASQRKETSICPRCTALPKQKSYTELEMVQQIEGIKTFANLSINDIGYAEYRSAFQDLCKKLFLADKQSNDEIANFSKCDLNPSDLISQKSYDCKINKSSDNSKDPPKEQQDTMKKSKPPITDSKPAMSNTQHILQKIRKASPRNDNTPLVAGKPIGHKDQDNLPKILNNFQVKCSKIQQSAVRTSRIPEPSLKAPTRTGVPLNNGSPNKLGSEKPQGEQEVKSIRTPINRSSEQYVITTSNTTSNGSSMDRQRKETSMNDPKLNTKGVPNQRVTLPRGTHASQMRQSEVKRRYSLLGRVESDVLIKSFLFK